MTSHRSARLVPAALTALLALLVSAAAAAQAPAANRLALEIRYKGEPKKTTPDNRTANLFDWKRSSSRKKAPRESFSRRVATHLEPMLQGLGYDVTRVHSAKAAIRSGDYDYAFSVLIDAKPVWQVHEARQYGKTVVHDSEVGVSAWGDWRAYGQRERGAFDSGKLGPIDSRVHDLPGGGRPEIDDEEAVARLFAGEVADRAGEVFRDHAEPAIEEWVEDE